jgi:hypothetical protein
MSKLSRLLVGVTGALVALALASCQSQSEKPPKDFVDVQFNLESLQGVPGASPEFPLSKQHIAYDDDPSLIGREIGGMKIQATEMGSRTVFSLTEDGRRDLYRLSTTHQGQRLVVTINGKPLGVTTMAGPISDGKLSFYLELSDVDLPELAKSINDSCIWYAKNLH